MLPHRRSLHIRVQLARVKIPKILGRLGRVVAADGHRVRVLADGEAQKARRVSGVLVQRALGFCDGGQELGL